MPLIYASFSNFKFLVISFHFFNFRDPEVCPDQQLARVTVDIQGIPAPKETQDRLGVMEHQVLKVIQVCPASVDQASKERREHVACPVHPACQDLTGRRAMQVFQDFQA